MILRYGFSFLRTPSFSFNWFPSLMKECCTRSSSNRHLVYRISSTPVTWRAWYKSLLHLLFRSLIEQSESLYKMLSWIVHHSGDTQITQIISQMGARHELYGVESDDYPVFASSLVDSLQMALGDRFPPRARAIWLEKLTYIGASTCHF